jgi:hypothetical protein
MSTATITPLLSGGAVFELNGISHVFPDWRAAVGEAEARHLPWILTPPNPVAGSASCGEPA